VDEDYLKILGYGSSGVGKSYMVASLLEEGLTVLVISTDIGGHGLTSVSQALKEKGKPELLKNCLYFEIQSYDEMDDFVGNPEGFWADIFNVDIDVLFLDGFASLQQCLLMDKVLGMTNSDKATEVRDAGLFADKMDWGAVKTGTVRVIDQFLRMRNTKTGKSWSKIVTSLESEKSKDSQGETKTGPLIAGAGARLIEPCFDLIFRLNKKKVDKDGGKKMEYYYQMEGSGDRMLAKSRGLKFNMTEPGDFGAIWRSACQQKGMPSGKKVAA
jgi:hypothetical protein